MIIVDCPVHHKHLSHRCDQGRRHFHKILGKEVGGRVVHFVGLLPQEDFSFQLESQDGAEKPVHEGADKHEEVAPGLVRDPC